MKKKTMALVIMIVLGVFLFIYTNSDRSLRFTVLIYGFPKEAMTSDIESVFKHDENTTYYVLDPTPVSNQTGPTNAWKVKRVGLFYFASYYGA
ncbi:hypothetical protein BW731_11560 [Vagococcus martis]|uniref:Uncharacterized protein n=1 Tax=Vagococcus martis TaxID=1768210 RepID=A0A1V4DJI8_9ENTE|nr:hypothetical protein [Vagococcus martis]OPF88757.1 hypothetical protein BW731_11560 [Vagococcus martis]